MSMLALKAAVPKLPFPLGDLEAVLVSAILRATRLVRSETVVAEIRRAIERGDIQGALDAVKMEIGRAELEEVIPQAVRSAYENAALTARGRLERTLGGRLRVSFDLLNPEAQRWIREHAAELIQAWGDSSLLAIRGYITAAYRTGATPAELARTIRESGIGLTERQVKALDAFRRGLVESGEWKPAQIEAKTKAYGDRLLRQRARLIARTETHRAAAEGNRELWRQAKAGGLLDDRARKEWQTTGQENVCPECDALDGERVPIDGTYSAGVEGPPLHPACSCTETLLATGG